MSAMILLGLLSVLLILSVTMYPEDGPGGLKCVCVVLLFILGTFVGIESVRQTPILIYPGTMDNGQYTAVFIKPRIINDEVCMDRYVLTNMSRSSDFTIGKLIRNEITLSYTPTNILHCVKYEEFKTIIPITANIDSSEKITILYFKDFVEN